MAGQHVSGFSVWRERLLVILTLAGIGIAGYLSYVKLFGLEPYCAGVGNCEAVQSSPYAELFGIPVAILGLATYVALLGLLLVKHSDWRGWGQAAEQVFFLVSLGGLIFSLYLTYLEIFVILEICPWCVASAVVMALLFALSLTEVLGLGLDPEDELAVEEARG